MRSNFKLVEEKESKVTSFPKVLLEFILEGQKSMQMETTPTRGWPQWKPYGIPSNKYGLWAYDSGCKSILSYKHGLIRNTPTSIREIRCISPLSFRPDEFEYRDSILFIYLFIFVWTSIKFVTGVDFFFFCCMNFNVIKLVTKQVKPPCKGSFHVQI